ncbi:exo-beta-N-acetylmuramidase NamZ domain-containing protein [Dysgonomonas sp. 511]|uniref:exo-beta-N-acetylmuramidase NamZ family protein n=1 Tax=Dysgonomonas sp. 511 TaxID=2302930 RepID=UPI0013D415B2|nr:DUF1343 domain-containing protein [Dysgonomonas sp. 511]NDV79241.1 DUF1343 domain-containing protein [Dysgonomonas sp. 511]
MNRFFAFLSIFILFSIHNRSFSQDLRMGADRIDSLLAYTKDKKAALIINQTSVLSDGTHILDTLLARNVHIEKIFAPEHGIRGNADAGEKIVDGKDSKTGIPIVSLYGKNYKPTAQQLDSVDILIFDIQDVGTRFYTYISTMHYAMEACAENGKQFIVLDRPNPNDYIDGPILDIKYRSFVGIPPIPVVHGLTVGELATMINGECWLKDSLACNLKVIPMEGWVHGQEYELPIKPSPNLPNQQAIKLYPSLCFFEATGISVGRGTDFPFQVIGAPGKRYGKFTFTPRPVIGAKNPLNKNRLCHGIDLREAETEKKINLDYLISFYKKSGKGAAFFTNRRFMDLLSGTDKLRRQIINGLAAEQIRESWEEDLTNYKTMREKYLLYPIDE